MSKPARILYIEDDEPERRAFMRLIGDRGLPWEVKHAGTLAAARAQLAQFRFDVIVATVTLSDGVSTELFDEARHIPFVLLLAGAPDEPWVRRALEHGYGANDYLLKDPEHHYREGLPGAVEKTLYRKAISEKEKAAFAAAQAFEGRYRTLINSMDEGFCIIEVIFDENKKAIDYRFLEINAAFEKQTGLIGAKGKRMRELAPKHEEHWFETYGKIALTGQPARFQNRAEQLQRWYDVYAFRFGQPGKRQVAIVFNDITERQRAEEALRASEEGFRLLVEDVKDYAILMLAPDGIVTTWNRGAERLKGYRAEEIIGQHFSIFFPADDVRACMPQKELQEAAEKGRIESEGWRVRKDGARFWANVVITALRDEAGRLRGFGKVTRDFSERKRVEDALRSAHLIAESAKAAAEEATQAKDRFLAVLSHELRTPLTPVLAAVQLMQRTQNLNEGLRQPLEVIRRNAQLQARLIDDLLDITRIVQGKVELDRRPLDIRTVIERAIETSKPDIEARKLHFGVDMKNAPCPVNGDAARLQQVIWNLLGNAVKFTADGGCIGIRCERADGRVMIEVADSGQGIEPDVLDRIFDAFEQGGRATTRQFGGLGLGLAIVKRLVEMHGGTISAHSEGRGKGSTFRISLPVASAQIDAEAETRAPPATGLSRRILLVEDNGDTAQMMAMLLEAFGYQVEAAGDVAQALQALASQEFDLLVSDLGLPDQSGIELMQELRRRGHTLKGIALSGYGHEEDVRRSRAAGFSAHLTKPVDADALVKVVASMI